MSMSVHTGELSAGVGKVAALFGDCDRATSGMADTLAGMMSAAGQPDLTSALESFTESSAHAMLNTGQVLTYIAAGLKNSAAQYASTESTNAGNIRAAGGAK